MKKIIILLSFGLLLSFNAAMAQSTTTESSNSTQTVTTTKTDKSEDSQNIMLYAVGGISLLALAIVVGMMYRDRKKSIGGIQSQSKTDPRPVTTQSINNPGSGV